MKIRYRADSFAGKVDLDKVDIPVRIWWLAAAQLQSDHADLFRGQSPLLQALSYLLVTAIILFNLVLLTNSCFHIKLVHICNSSASCCKSRSIFENPVLPKPYPTLRRGRARYWTKPT